MKSALVNLPAREFADDRRSAQRYTTLLRVARVVTETEQQHLCLIRNIGPGGLMLETYTPFELGLRVRVEPKGSDPLTGVICWTKGKCAGVAFTDNVDVDAYLHSHQLLPAGHKPRCPRVTTEQRGRLRIGPVWYPVRVLDVSQGGAKIETELPMELEASVELSIDRLTPHPARVRWIRNDRIGLAFTSALPLADVAKWADGPARYEANRHTPGQVTDNEAEGVCELRKPPQSVSDPASYHLARARQEHAGAALARSSAARLAHLQLADLHLSAARAAAEI